MIPYAKNVISPEDTAALHTFLFVVHPLSGADTGGGGIIWLNNCQKKSKNTFEIHKNHLKS